MNTKDVPKTVDEYAAAKALARGVQTLRNDRYLGRGCPYLKLGRSVRYLMDDIWKYLEEHRIDPEK